MGRLTSFTYVSVDGAYAGPHGDIDWFKDISKDADFDAWSHSEAGSDNTLVFGRTTYQMMKSWWPTPQAMQADPHMAKVVNESPKIVFSGTLGEAQEAPHWKNVTVVREVDAKDVRKRKDRANSLTILGSGSIVRQLSNLGLIDEYALVVVPLVLPDGKRLFQDVEKKSLALLESRSFKNGLTVMRFEPRKKD